MRFIYIAHPDSLIPSEKAHCLQILKTCDQLINNNNELDLEIIVAQRKRKSEVIDENVNIKNYFKLDNNLVIKRIRAVEVILPFRYPKLLKLMAEIVFYGSYYIFLTFYLIRNKQESIIYSRDIYALFLISLYKKNNMYYYESHDFPGSNIGRIIQAGIITRLNGIISICEPLTEFYKELSPDQNHITIQDGVEDEMMENISKDKARKITKLPRNKIIVMYTGNIYKSKGIYSLAEAAGILNNEYLIYIIGGDNKSEDMNNLKDFINQKNIKNIILTGYVQHSDIKYYLHSADILLLPNSKNSINTYLYTSPMKLFEYMASNRPIIASNVPAYADILKHKTNAYLVEPDNAVEIADAITMLSSNIKIADEISENAFKEANKYTWNERSKKILMFIRDSGFRRFS